MVNNKLYSVPVSPAFTAAINEADGYELTLSCRLLVPLLNDFVHHLKEANVSNVWT